MLTLCNKYTPHLAGYSSQKILTNLSAWQTQVSNTCKITSKLVIKMPEICTNYNYFAVL